MDQLALLGGATPSLAAVGTFRLTAALEASVMNSDQVRQRAEKGLKHHGRKTLIEYEARAREIREKTERLRALRLAKEAQERESKRNK